MEFFDNTLSWIKGELFEAAFVLSFGIATIMAGFLCWKMGATASAKALFLPFVLTGLVYTGVGGTMHLSNKKRTAEFSVAYKKDKRAFVKSEKKRVDEFQYQYQLSKVVATLCFLITLGLFWFTNSPTWQGAGIGLSLFGLAGLVVDYFSEERAKTYYAAILETLRQIN